VTHRDVRTAVVTIEGSEFLVVEWPCQSTQEAPALTAAERSVVAMVATGASNAEIARARGRSPRTIANQIASIMRKLGVGSRVAIAAWNGR
jgi:DNA-binding CsgD family transcriptional regulator